jgi:hypothetical protein
MVSGRLSLKYPPVVLLKSWELFSYELWQFAIASVKLPKGMAEITKSEISLLSFPTK